MKRLDRALDWWREKYSFYIPTTVSLLYLLVYACLNVEISDSSNLPDALIGIITAVSIMTGLLSTLFGSIVQKRGKDDAVDYFFKNVDRIKLVQTLRNCVFSGFLSILLSCAMFFEDTVSNRVIFAFATAGWMWVLIRYFALSYRFSSVFISLILAEKKPMDKKKAVGRVDDDELKKKIKNQR